MKVYVAAALASFARAQHFADRIAAAEHQIVSRWHSSASVRGGAPDPRADVERQVQLFPNVTDLERADILVVLADQGQPRATFVEAGYALGRGLPVVWVIGPNGEGRCLFDSHPAVVRLESSLFDNTQLVSRVVTAIRSIEAAR